MNFWSYVREADARSRGNSKKWAVLQIFFTGFLPILTTYAFLLAQTGQVFPREPFRHGELALLSLSMLSSGLFVIFKGYSLDGIPSSITDANKETKGFQRLTNILSNVPFPGWQSVGVWASILVALSTLLFAFSVANELSANAESITINLEFIRLGTTTLLDLRIWLSLVLLIASFITTYLINIVDEEFEKKKPDVAELFGADYPSWRNRFGPEIGDENGE